MNYNFEHGAEPLVLQFLATTNLKPGHKRRFLKDLYEQFQSYLDVNAIPYGCTKHIFSKILGKHFYYGNATRTLPGSKPTTQRFFWMNQE